MAAFQAELDIQQGRTTFCEATVNTATGDARSGCMLAAAALGHSERVTEIRSWLAKGFTASTDIFAKRFEQEIKAGRLTRTPSAKVRGRLLVDLLQGLQLRRCWWYHSRRIAGRRTKLCAPDSWRANQTHVSVATRLDEYQIANALTDTRLVITSRVLVCYGQVTRSPSMW